MTDAFVSEVTAHVTAALLARNGSERHPRYNRLKFRVVDLETWLIHEQALPASKALSTTPYAEP